MSTPSTGQTFGEREMTNLQRTCGKWITAVEHHPLRQDGLARKRDDAGIHSAKRPRLTIRHGTDFHYNLPTEPWYYGL